MVDPRQDEVDQEGWELWGMDNPMDELMDAMDEHAPPQRIKAIMDDIMDDVWNRDNGDGWFDIVGVVCGVPLLVIRYQWWEPHGWHYRIIDPSIEHQIMD